MFVLLYITRPRGITSTIAIAIGHRGEGHSGEGQREGQGTARGRVIRRRPGEGQWEGQGARGKAGGRPNGVEGQGEGP